MSKSKISNEKGYYIVEEKPYKSIKYKDDNVTVLEFSKVIMPEKRKINSLFGFWHGGQSQGKFENGKTEFEPKDSKLHIYYDKYLKNFKGYYILSNRIFKI